MSAAIQLCFHIGLIKTGTTYLQSQVFPSLPGVRFIKPKETIYGSPLFTKEAKYLISDERMSGNPFLANKRHLSYRDQFFWAVSRLKQLHPTAKVICCFREPAAFAQSAYKQYLHEGGTLEFESFFGFSGKGVLGEQDLKFSEFMNHLQAQFGNENLFVYDFSDFCSHRIAVLQGMCQFLGISADGLGGSDSEGKRVNPSVPFHLEPLLINLNKLNARFLRATGRRLQLRLGGKTLNGRVLAQYIVPKVWKRNETRDLDELREYFQSDWRLCKSMMQNFEPTT